MNLFAFTLMASLVSFSSQAAEIRSTEATVNIARVIQVINLVATPEIQVNIAVQDRGGSTDMSPTQTVYLALYAKGEMFSTHAAFEIANVFGVKNARRIKGGVYEVTVLDWVDQQGLVDVAYVIDARRAIVEMKKVDCGGNFDCDASENFRSTISVVRK